ncbi:MAG: phosphoserine phosphatase SerB [Pseudomonadota bacterium]
MDQVLILTAPQSRGLSDHEITELGGWAGSAPRRLGPNGAEAMLRADHPRPTLDDVDLNILPAANRRKKLLIADMDSTMIPVECIDEMADFAGIGEEVAAITARAMRGDLDFSEAMEARVALIEGLPVTALQDVYDQRINLNPGGRALVRTMAAQGAYTALISGGFTFFTERVGAAAGFHEHRANTLGVADGALDGAIVPPVLGRQSKLDALHELTAKHAITSDDALTLGDGANDLAMIEAAGLGVGHHPKPLIAEAANAVLRYSDLDAVLYLQGYSADEFVLD